MDGAGNTNGFMADSVDGSVEGGRDLLDGVSAGLMHKGLADGLVGTDGTRDSLMAEGGDVLEDGLSSMGGLHNRGRLVSGNWGRDVGVGGLSDRVGNCGDLGCHLSEGMSLSGGVGKVATQPVVLNGGGVMGGCPDQVGCWGHEWGGRGNTDGNGAGTAESDQGGEEQEGLKKENVIMIFDEKICQFNRQFMNSNVLWLFQFSL
jgi:hypothetical protein